MDLKDFINRGKGIAGYALIADSFPRVNTDLMRKIIKDCVSYTGELCGLTNALRNPAIILYGDVPNPNIHEKAISNVTTHFITLTFSDDEWPELIFQFVHEWMHHILGEELPKSYDGLMWVEEVFCEIMSYEALAHFSVSLKEICPIEDPCDWIPRSLKYFSDSGTNTEVPSRGHTADNPTTLPDLQEKPSDKWTYLAQSCFQYFHQDPELFRIFAAAGRPSRFDTIQHYLLEIRSLASGRCNDSLSSIESYLLNYYNA